MNAPIDYLCSYRHYVFIYYFSANTSWLHRGEILSWRTFIIIIEIIKAEKTSFSSHKNPVGNGVSRALHMLVMFSEPSAHYMEKAITNRKDTEKSPFFNTTTM